MTTLHLGVMDVPYVRAPPKRRRAKTMAGEVTTGQVAEWLENKYHILEHFWQIHGKEAVADLELSLSGTLENLMMGSPLGSDPYAAAESSIEDRMKRFIIEGEMDALGYPGIPTKAARERASGRRRSSRFKRRRGTGARPVSFYDSGLYQSSLKAWVE